MAGKTMAFGTRQYAMFVRAPFKGLASPYKGQLGARTLSNGQGTINRSKVYRKHFDFVYKGTDLELQSIRDFIGGRYGQGPFMFHHPRALNGNMLPRPLASPAFGLGARGNQALDFWTSVFTFGAPLSAPLANPNEQPLTITGLTGAPVTGACIYSASITPPVLPINYNTRPFHSILVPPNYLARITVWGSRNGGTSPVLMYALSNVAPTNITIPAGTAIAPVLAGTTVAPAGSANWRVLDLWIGSGQVTPVNTDYTTFGAMDVRMALGSAPAQPTVFDFGRGQYEVQFSEDTVPENNTMIGTSDAKTFSEIDGSMEEVAKPW